jgi:uncharacterized protein (DUF58 family)
MTQEFHYRISWPALGHFPGHHKSHRGESGFEFRGHASLLDAPDPRRLDLHASLRDPYGQWIVRVYSQRKSIPVYLLADLSASMQFVGARRKQDVMADFTESLAYSVYRTGDSFGFIGCDEHVRQDLLLPATHTKGAGTGLGGLLREMPLHGRSAAGLLESPRYMKPRRALVFLLSDFHMPSEIVAEILAGLARHEVVPVVVWDAAEFPGLTGYGLARLSDAETGRSRLMWLRPAQRQKWRDRLAGRRAMLAELFRRHQLRPLFLENGFHAEAVTAHFFS